MIDLGRPQGFVVRRAGARALRPGDGARPEGGRDRLRRLGRQRRLARGRGRGRRRRRRPAAIDWSRVTALIISPASRAACPSRIRSPRRRAPPARRSSATSSCWPRRSRRRGFVGITGTNGKSTTTALIGHILSRGRPALRGRRQYRPRRARSRAARAGAASTCSSCRPISSSCSRPSAPMSRCWLNITPDHIDRHGDMAGYVAAKENIFARQQPGDCAVIGIDDESSRAVYAKMAARAGIVAVPVALERPVARRRVVPRRHADRCRRLHRRLRRRADPAGRPQCAERRLRLGGLPLARRAAREDRGRASRPIPACRTARSASPRSAMSSTSTTARRPTPTPRRARCRPTATSTGSSAARRRRAAWRRSRRGSTASAMPS